MGRQARRRLRRRQHGRHRRHKRADGKYVVLDGQHRRAAALLVEFNGKVQCSVREGLTLQEEARLFLDLNNSKMVSPISKFQVRVIQGDPAAVAINRVLESMGWEVSSSNSDGRFRSVAAIERVYDGVGLADRGQIEWVEQVMLTITTAWGGDSKGPQSPIITGIGMMIARYGDAVDFDKLAAEMSKHTPGQLIGRARGLREAQGGTTAAAMAKVLVGLHNTRRRKNPLPDWVWVR